MIRDKKEFFIRMKEHVTEDGKKKKNPYLNAKETIPK